MPFIHSVLPPDLELLVAEILRTKQFNNRSEIVRHAIRFTFGEHVQVPPGYRVELIPINGQAPAPPIVIKRRGRIAGRKDGEDLKAMRRAAYGPPKTESRVS